MVIFLNNAFKKRIDELGRIVIPKQIRDDFKINNYDELDIFMKDDSIIIKKNIGLLSNKEIIENFIFYVASLIDFDIIIYENNKVFLSTLSNYNDFKDNTFDYNCVNFTNSKYYFKTNIIIDSNYLGYIVFISDNNFDKDNNNIKMIKSILIDLIK